MKNSAKKLRIAVVLQTLIAATALVFAVSVNAANEVEQTVTSVSSDSLLAIDEGGYRPHLGVSVGVANPEGNYESAPVFGVDFGFRPSLSFGLGAMITAARNESKNLEHDLEHDTTELGFLSFSRGGRALSGSRRRCCGHILAQWSSEVLVLVARKFCAKK
jgi:hypothetical protein